MRPLARAAYLLLAFWLGTVWFVLIVAGFATGVGLAVTLVGLPILAGVVYLTRAAAQLERSLLTALLGEVVVPHYRRPERPGVWPAVLARLGDPQTWKDVVYLLAQFPLGLLYTVVVGGLFGVALGGLTMPAWSWTEGWPDGPLWWLLFVPVGALAALLLRRAVGALARLHAGWARLLLTSPPDPELEAQVDDARSAQARIIEATDAERRRLERDLHDGAQQRLVALSLKLGMAKAQLARARDADAAAALVAEAHAESQAALAELRDLARGIHPAVLTDRGLAPALDELAARSAVPTRVVQAPGDRLPSAVEAAAYFVVAEALANVAKYADAASATVTVLEAPDRVVVEVQDDGRGGADPGRGSGLRGLGDRVGALGGRLEVLSPPGHGTRVRAELPLAGRA
jgi:signal transduction histidine kinase